MYIFCLSTQAIAGPIRTYDDLVKLIKEKKIQSIEELLPHLDSSLLTNYSLVYDTRSPQNASLEKPRVILTNSNSSFTLAYSGDGDSTNGQVLEIVQKNDKTNSLEFSKVNFSKKDSTRFSHGDKGCVKCHGSKLPDGKIHMNYIWDGYPDWGGVYGSSHNGSTNKTPFGASSNLIPEFERKGFGHFQETAKTQKRYKYLNGIDRISVEDLGTFNSNLTEIFRGINHDILAKKIIENPELTKYIKHYVNLGLNGHDSFTKSLTPELLKEYEQFKAENQTKIVNQMSSYIEKSKKRSIAIGAINNIELIPEYSIYSSKGKLEIIDSAFILNKLGINLDNISQTLPTGGLDFMGSSTATGIKEFLTKILENGLSDKFPEIRKYYNIDVTSNNAKFFHEEKLKLTKVLFKPSNKKIEAIQNKLLMELENTKNIDEYLFKLNEIGTSTPEFFNSLVSKTNRYFLKLKPNIKQIKKLESFRLMDNKNRMILVDEALSMAKNSEEFLAAIYHQGSRKIQYVEDADFLMSKYFEKLLSFNPDPGVFLKLEAQNFVRPHILGEIYRDISGRFDGSDDFVDYFKQRENLGTTSYPRQRFLLSKILIDDIDKYIGDMSLDDLKVLVNSSLLYDDAHAKVSSKVLKMINTKEEFKKFKFRKKSSPEFKMQYKEFLRNNPDYTLVGCVTQKLRKLLGK